MLIFLNAKVIISNKNHVTIRFISNKESTFHNISQLLLGVSRSLYKKNAPHLITSCNALLSKQKNYQKENWRPHGDQFLVITIFCLP